MAQETDAATEAIDHRLADAVKTWDVSDAEAEAFADFIEAALGEAEDMLKSNREYAERRGMDEDPQSVESVLSPDNVRDVEWEADRFKGKRVTVWLRDCPTWANDAQKRTFPVGDLNQRNRQVRAVIDVRPF